MVDYFSCILSRQQSEDVDMESEADENDAMVVDDAYDDCPSPQADSPCPSSPATNGMASEINGTDSDRGITDEPVTLDGQNSVENGDATVVNGNGNSSVEAASNGIITPPPNETLIGNGETTQRRRSVRQALRAKKIEEEKEKARKEQERLKKEEEADRAAWKPHPANIEGSKKPAQKRNVRKVPRKRPISKVTEKTQKTALDFINDIFHVETKLLKKINGISKLTVNAAFEQIILERLKEQQELFQICRKKLKLDNEVELKEEPQEEEIKDSDHDNDLGVEPLPDIDDDNDDNVCDNVDDLGEVDVNETTSLSCNDSYERMVLKHNAEIAEEMQRHCSNTDLYEKVGKWEQRIKPILEEQERKENFEIHEYGTRVLNRFNNHNRKQTIPFADITHGKPAWEICRYFLASLQLVNNCNIDITTTTKPSGNHEVYLTLLSRKRHQEQLDEFGHNLREH